MIGSPSDHELMALVREGDEDAFLCLYERHRDRVLAHAERMLRDAAMAEDVLQEAFLYVFRLAPRYEPRAQFTTLLYRAVRSLCLDRIERGRRRRTVEIPVSAEDPSAPDPVGRAEAREEAARLEAAVAELPAIYREVVSLRLTGGLSYEEIAQVAGVPLGTVKSRLHQAMERLRRALAPASEAETGEPRRPPAAG